MLQQIGRRTCQPASALGWALTMHCGARGDFPSRKGTLPLVAKACTPKRYEQSSSDLELGLSWRIVAVLGVVGLSAEVRLSRKAWRGGRSRGRPGTGRGGGAPF